MRRKLTTPLVYFAVFAAAFGGLVVACADSGSETTPTMGRPVVPGTGGFPSTGENTGTGAGGIEYADPVDPYETDAGTDGEDPDAAAGTGTPPVQDPLCPGLDTSKPFVVYLSADDSNSMASPAHCRDLLSLGIEPRPSQVRTYEFLNYYKIQYTPPEFGKLQIYPEIQPTKEPKLFEFQIALRSYDAVTRRPMNMTFVVDTSSSMQGPGISRAKAAMAAIASQFATDDVVDIVTWNKENTILLKDFKVAGPNDPKVLQAIDSLTTGGDTALSQGLLEGYNLASAHVQDGRMSRIVLISDGGANVALTDAEKIGDYAEVSDKEGIYLVGVGTGPPLTYNDTLMNIVTDRGRGAYIYLDSDTEAKRMFADRFDETMEIAARGVELELTLPWYFNVEATSAEHTGRKPSDVKGQHLAPSDAMVFLQSLSVCNPAVIQNTDLVTIRATWKNPLSYEDRLTEFTTTVQALLEGPKPTLPKGKAIVAYAEALKMPSQETLAKAHDLVVKADPMNIDPELKEIRGLIEKHPQY